MTRKMRDSGIEWIGEIPEEWEVKTLKRAFSDRAGGAWGEEAKGDENDRICIRIADFDYSKLKIKTEIEFTKRNYNTDVIRKLELKQGDILVEKSGGGETTPVGRTILYDLPMNALYANFMDRLRVHKNNFPKFIEYVLVAFYQQGITKQYIKQTTGIQNLDLTSMLADEQIVLPQQKKQQEIANYLDNKCSKIDQTIEKEKQVIEKLKEYKQSVITEAVTKGLNPHVKMKDSGVEWIGEIPEHWGIKALKYSIEYNKYNLSEKTDDKLNIRYIDIGSVTNEDGIKEIQNYTFDNAPSRARRIVKKGDTIISTVRTYLKAIAYISDEYDGFICSTGFAVCTPKDCYIDKYMFYCLHAEWFVSIVESISVGISYPAINTTNLMNLKNIVPPIEEQKEIADYLDKKCSSIDKLILNKEQLIEKLTEYKKSLIYECVTGKREVQ